MNARTCNFIDQTLQIVLIRTHSHLLVLTRTHSHSYSFVHRPWPGLRTFQDLTIGKNVHRGSYNKQVILSCLDFAKSSDYDVKRYV